MSVKVELNEPEWMFDIQQKYCSLTGEHPTVMNLSPGLIKEMPNLIYLGSATTVDGYHADLYLHPKTRVGYITTKESTSAGRTEQGILDLLKMAPNDKPLAQREGAFTTLLARAILLHYFDAPAITPYAIKDANGEVSYQTTPSVIEALKARGHLPT